MKRILLIAAGALAIAACSGHPYGQKDKVSILMPTEQQLANDLATDSNQAVSDVKQASAEDAKPSNEALFVSKHQDGSKCKSRADFDDFQDAQHLTEVSTKGDQVTYNTPDGHTLVTDETAMEVCFVSAK